MVADQNTHRIAKNTLVLYVRMLFQMGVLLYTSRVLLQALGVVDYGIYDVVGGLVMVMMFLNNSLAVCSQRYVTFALGTKNTDYLQKVFTASVVIHILMAVLLIVIGESVGLWYIHNHLVFPEGRLEDVVMVFHFSLLTGALMIINVPYNATIVAHEEMTAFAVISILDVFLKLCVAVSLYFVDDSRIVVYAIMMFAESLLIRIVYGLYCKYKFKDIRFVGLKDRRLYREMLRFAGWSTIGNTAYVMNTQGINLVLNFFFGPVVNAARGIAFNVQVAMNAFISSFQTAINPQITKQYAQGNLVMSHELILRSSRLSFMLTLLVVIPLGLDTAFYLQLWLGEVPEYVVSFTRLLLCTTMVEAMGNPLTIGATATGNIKKYHLLIGSSLLMVLPFASVVAYSLQLPQSVFAVLLGVTILTQFIRVYLCRSLYDFPVARFFREVVRPVSFVAVVCVSLPLVLVQCGGFESWWSHFLLAAIILVWVVLSIFIFGLQADERNFVMKKIRRK